MLSSYQRALLDAIAGGEAPAYNVMYGGGTFNDYADHPRQNVRIASGPNAGQTSSAAGRYQFLAPTWDEARNTLGLSDFSPSNQDTAAWWLADKTYRTKTGRGLEDDLKAGNIAQVGPALSGVWTSLPGGIEPNNATNSFAARYNASLAGKGPLNVVSQAPTQGSKPMAQDQGSLASQFIAGGPGALFGAPEDNYDWGGRLQQAAAFIGSISDPKFLSVIPALQKAAAGKYSHDDVNGIRTYYNERGLPVSQGATPGYVPPEKQKALDTAATKAAENTVNDAELAKGGQTVLDLTDQLGAKIRDPKFAQSTGPYVGAAADASVYNPARWAYESMQPGENKAFLDQIKSDAQGLNSQMERALLKGGGSITEEERRQVQAILGAITTSRRPEDAMAQLENFRGIVRRLFRMPTDASTSAAPAAVPAGVTIRQIR